MLVQLVAVEEDNGGGGWAIFFAAFDDKELDEDGVELLLQERHKVAVAKITLFQGYEVGCMTLVSDAQFTCLTYFQIASTEERQTSTSLRVRLRCRNRSGPDRVGSAACLAATVSSGA